MGSVTQAVKTFEVTLSAVHKSSRACKVVVGAIAGTACFVVQQLPASGQLPSLHETFAKLTARHQEVAIHWIPRTQTALHGGALANQHSQRSKSSNHISDVTVYCSPQCIARPITAGNAMQLSPQLRGTRQGAVNSTNLMLCID